MKEEHIDVVLREVRDPQRHILECQVMIPGCEVTWFRDGEEIEPGDKYKYRLFGLTHQMVIKEPPPDEPVHDYTCIVVTPGDDRLSYWFQYHLKLHKTS
jgi:hypothetical protein